MEREEDAMGKLKLTASQRRKIRTRLRETHDVRLYRRLLAVLELDRRTPVSAIAELLGVSCQSVYNWITRFQNGGGNGCELSDAPQSGRPTRAGEVINVLLQTLLILSPEWFGYYATHWTVPLLKNQLRQNTGEQYSSDTIRRRLHELGYVWKRPRYVLAPDPEREKKTPNSARPVRFATAERCIG
jgi:transposase